MVERGEDERVSDMTADPRVRALYALITLVQEEAPLHEFNARIKEQNTVLQVGWPFASWALGEWVRRRWVEFVSLDTWTWESIPAPPWLERSRVQGEWWVLEHDDALALARDIERWRGRLDGFVQVVPLPHAPDDHQWVESLTDFADAPPVGPDEVSRADALARAAHWETESNPFFDAP
jgi:hypothetical protein